MGQPASQCNYVDAIDAPSPYLIAGLPVQSLISVIRAAFVCVGRGKARKEIVDHF